MCCVPSTILAIPFPFSPKRPIQNPKPRPKCCIPKAVQRNRTERQPISGKQRNEAGKENAKPKTRCASTSENDKRRKSKAGRKRQLEAPQMMLLLLLLLPCRNTCPAIHVTSICPVNLTGKRLNTTRVKKAITNGGVPEE